MPVSSPVAYEALPETDTQPTGGGFDLTQSDFLSVASLSKPRPASPEVPKQSPSKYYFCPMLTG